MPAKHPTWAALYALFVAVFALPADAAVMSRDWKVPGDGLLTFDDVNRREWLDVPETLLADFVGATVLEGYEKVIAELAPDGAFAGFSLSTRDDVVALAVSAGIDTNTFDFTRNSVPTSMLLDLLGSTSESHLESKSTFGLIDEFANAVEVLPDQLVAGLSFSSLANGAGLRFVEFRDLTDRPHLITGFMLSRPVPEPTSGVIVFTFLALLSAVRSIRSIRMPRTAS